MRRRALVLAGAVLTALSGSADFGMRGNRVRFVALADHDLRRRPHALGRYVRLSGTTGA